jgi:uncharacterized protein YndB with AHSA1/START domain
MLDLKIMAHHGEFEEMQVGPVKDISGADVILVHRMAKTNASEATGVRSYALFSDAAVEAMEIKAALMAFSQPFEHFGEVSMQVYDLAKAWEKFRSKRERHFLEEADGVFTFRRHFEIPIAVVWELLTAPELKQRWMDSINSVTVENTKDRIGTGTGYHCAHEMADFRYWITDWEPFEYFSTRIADPGREGVSMPETYHLTETEKGTDLRYTFGQAHDTDGNRSEISEQGSAGFLAEFWRLSFDAMEAQHKAAD